MDCLIRPKNVFDGVIPMPVGARSFDVSVSGNTPTATTGIFIFASTNEMAVNALSAIMQKWCDARTVAEALELLEANRIPAGAVYTPQQTLWQRLFAFLLVFLLFSH